MSQTTRRSLLVGAAASAAALPKASMAKGFGAWFETPQKVDFDKGDIDYIQVRKKERKLQLIGNGKILKTYEIMLGGNPVGHKRFRLDNRTPEGAYRIDRRNPNSRFYRSLGISYPNRWDRAYAAKKGKSPGGDIFIHGQPNGYKGTLLMDWTRGCIAVSNADMSELWSLIPVGCKIQIFA